jgi:hypothetical protein
MSALMIYGFGLDGGLTYIPVYVIAFLLGGSFDSMMGQLESSSAKLEGANNQLQRYARLDLRVAAAPGC